MNYINQRRIRILHVDDEAVDLKMTKLFLEKKGDADFEITSVLSAEDALAKLESGHFEVIISDYNMPGMDGIEFFEEVGRTVGNVHFIFSAGWRNQKLSRMPWTKAQTGTFRRPGILPVNGMNWHALCER